MAALLQITSFSGNDDNSTFIVVVEPTNGASAITVAVSEGQPLDWTPHGVADRRLQRKGSSAEILSGAVSPRACCMDSLALCSMCRHSCSAAASLAALQQTVPLPIARPREKGDLPPFCPADAYTDLAGNTGSANIDSVVGTSTGSATTESSSSSASSGAASLGNGAIIGIAIGGFFFLLLLILLFLVVSCSAV